jgi:hypothetical protein
MSERWQKKIKDEFDRDVQEKTALLINAKQGRELTKLEKIKILIDVFEERNKPIEEEEVKYYDLRDPIQRAAYEETKYYAFYFLVNCKRFASPNMFCSEPSKRDIELAKELGYQWEAIDKFKSFRLVPLFPKEQMDNLLEDACYKYGYTYEGILMEQRTAC